MDQLRNNTIPDGNKMNPVSAVHFNILTNNGRYHTHDMQKFMTSIGLDPSIIGIGDLLNGNVGVDLTSEFYKEFVLSDYFKGDKMQN